MHNAVSAAAAVGAEYGLLYQRRLYSTGRLTDNRIHSSTGFCPCTAQPLQDLYLACPTNMLEAGERYPGCEGLGLLHGFSR